MSLQLFQKTKSATSNSRNDDLAYGSNYQTHKDNSRGSQSSSAELQKYDANLNFLRDENKRLRKKNESYEKQICEFQEQYYKESDKPSKSREEDFNIRRILDQMFQGIQNWSRDQSSKIPKHEYENILRNEDFQAELEKVSWEPFFERVDISFLVQAVVANFVGESVVKSPVQWCDPDFERWFHPISSQKRESDISLAQEWERSTLDGYLALEQQLSTGQKLLARNIVEKTFRETMLGYLNAIVIILGVPDTVDTQTVDRSLQFIDHATKIVMALYRQPGKFSIYAKSQVEKDGRRKPKGFGEFDYKGALPLGDTDWLVDLVLQPGICWTDDEENTTYYKSKPVVTWKTVLQDQEQHYIQADENEESPGEWY